MKTTHEIMKILAENRHSIPAFVKVELQERDDEIESLQKKINAVKQALADGPQPCPGGETGQEYNTWLYSVLPFLEEDEVYERSSLSTEDH